ncbi:MAG: DUF58 domain-containing protein [Pseudomonadales bacterium]|nr:DUF58 domain-containing protein [Pseudomonadales bacterium]
MQKLSLKFSASLKRSIVWRVLRGLLGLFPLTFQGVLTLLATALALSIFGYGSMDLVVFALAICALAILVFSLFCAVLSGVIMQRRIARLMTANEAAAKPISLECGFPNESGFQLPALNYLPLIRLDWRVVYPDCMETRIRLNADQEMSEELLPRQRCLTEKVTRQFTVSDVLGFCRFSWRQNQIIQCLALPQTNTMKSMPLLRSMTSEDGIPNPAGAPEGDRMEIRRYAPGDSVRDIMWKAYARSGQLNVRLAEKSVFHSQRTIAYLVAGPGDEAAAAVARIALERGALGEDWAFGADGSEQACENLPDALLAIARSRAIDSEPAYGLDRFLQRHAGGGVHCIVFCSAREGPWRRQLQNTFQAFPGQFSLVMATDGFEEAIQTPLWKRILLKSQENSTTGMNGRTKKADLLGLLTEMGQLVESTQVVDRHSGSSFDQQLRKL